MPLGYSSTFYTEHVRHQEAVAREKRIIQEHPPGIPDSDRDALMASMGYYGRPGSGKSLPYSEVVFARVDGQWGFFKIGDLVEKMGNKVIHVVSLDSEELHLRIMPVSGRFRLQSPETLVEVRTRSGRRIRATSDHSFLTLDSGGRITTISCQNLHPGIFVPVPRFLPTATSVVDIKTEEFLEAGTYRDGDRYIAALQYVQSRLPCGNRKLKPIVRLACQQNGIPISSLYFGKPRDRMDSLARKAHLMKGRFLSRQRNSGGLPKRMVIDAGVMALSGAYVSEGCVSSGARGSSKFVSITNTDFGYLKAISSFLMELGFNPRLALSEHRAPQIIVSDTVLSRFLENAFGATSREKKVPAFLINASSKLQGEFLRFYFEGDGWIETCSVHAMTASEQLAHGVGTLLLLLGIPCRFRQRTVSGGIYHEICIRGREHVERFADQVGFFSKTKRDRLRIALESDAKGTSSIDPVPYAPKIAMRLVRFMKMSSRKDEEKRGFYNLVRRESQEKNRVQRQTLTRWIAKLSDAQGAPCGDDLLRLKRLALSDVLWDEVKEVKIVPRESEYVYDLSVEGTENFVAGWGHMFIHNTLCMLYDSLERYANIHKPELGVPNGMKVVCLDLLGKGEYCSVGLPMTPNHILYEKLIELGGHPEHYPLEILRPLIFSRGRPELPYRQPKVVRPYTISMQDITEEEWSSFVGLTEGQQRLHGAVLRKAQAEPNWPEMGMQDLYMIVQSMLGNRRIGFSPHIEGLEKADAIPLSSKVYTGREASGLLQRYERLMNLSIIMPQQRDGKPVASNLDVRKILEAKKKISVFLLPDIEDAPFLNYALARYVLERIFWFKHPNNTDRITVPVTIALPEASKSVPRKIHDENKRYFIDPLKSTVIKLASQAPGMGIQVNCDAQRPLDLADEFRELNAVMKIFDLGEDAAEVIRELLRGRYVANYKEITDENSRFLTALRDRGTFIHIGFGSIYAELCAGAICGVWYPRASGGSGETETNFYQLYERYGKPEDWTDIGHMYAESIRINFDRQNIAAAAMREMLDKEESEKENKKAGRKATKLGYDKPEDTVTLGAISDLVKETGLDRWDSFEDFVKRLSEKADLPRSKVYPILRRFNSRYILVDKTEGLKRQRVTILMDRISAKLGEAAKDAILPEAT